MAALRFGNRGERAWWNLGRGEIIKAALETRSRCVHYARADARAPTGLASIFSFDWPVCCRATEPSILIAGSIRVAGFATRLQQQLQRDGIIETYRCPFVWHCAVGSLQNGRRWNIGKMLGDRGACVLESFEKINLFVVCAKKNARMDLLHQMHRVHGARFCTKVHFGR